MARAVAPGRKRGPLLALFVAETISRCGSTLTRVALPWFVLETTGSAAKLGLTAGIESLALVAAGILGGPLVDRLGFTRSAIAAEITSGVAVALVPLLYLTAGLPFWQLMALAALAALFGIPDLTAHIGLVPSLADAAGMPRERANSVSQSIANLANLAGPVIAGLLVAALGASNVLWFDAASFAVSATLIAMWILAPSGEDAVVGQEAAGTAGSGPGQAGEYLFQLVEGLRFIRRDRVIRPIVVTSVAINFAYVPVLSVVLIVYAERVLSGVVDLGLLLGAFGIGALAGSALYGILGPRLPRRVTLAAANTALSASTLALIMAPSLPAAVVALVCAGVALGPGNPIIYTVTQERTPESLLGRVTGAQLALSNAAVPLGTMLAGYLLDAIGVRSTLAASAATILAGAAYTALSPALKGLDVRHTAEPVDTTE